MRNYISFYSKTPYLGLNTSQIKHHLKHFKCISQEDNDREIHLTNLTSKSNSHHVLKYTDIENKQYAYYQKKIQFIAKHVYYCCQRFFSKKHCIKIIH